MQMQILAAAVEMSLSGFSHLSYIVIPLNIAAIIGLNTF